MNQFYRQNSQRLKQLMEQVGISSIGQLANVAGVSERQIIRMQYGLLLKLPVETLLKLSQALQMTPRQLLTQFAPESVPDEQETDADSLKQEYQRLQQQLLQQRDTLQQEFQQLSLQVLESWLVQWPTAAAAAEKNPQLPAVRLLPLLKPVEQLLKQWGIEAIASVGDEIAYDPQHHQLIEGTAAPGELVKVRYTGYRQGEKLLHRAKVSPVNSD